MAHPEHVARLLQDVDTWNDWRAANPASVPELSGADLRGANLRNANLSMAQLILTKLTGADLSKADLTSANLHVTFLGGANLSGCDLTFAKFAGTLLTNTVMDAAVLNDSIFAGVDLSAVKGLTACVHNGPSYVSIETFQRSGRLPERFLRGCGLPDMIIAQLNGHLDPAIDFYSTFISFSYKDAPFSERIYDGLQTNHVRCWFAPEDLKIGDPIRSTIDSAIRLRDKVILILSEASIASDWVEHEVNEALHEEQRRGQTVLFPIRIDDAVMATEFGWAKALREGHKPTGRNIGDFRNWDDPSAFRGSLQRLLRDLRRGRDG